VIEFDQPQVISCLSSEVEERAVERTQEIRGEISDYAGASYRRIFVQDIPLAREAPLSNTKSSVSIASRSIVSV
jgi:hypothetical protein